MHTALWLHGMTGKQCEPDSTTSHPAFPTPCRCARGSQRRRRPPRPPLPKPCGAPRSRGPACCLHSGARRAGGQPPLVCPAQWRAGRQLHGMVCPQLPAIPRVRPLECGSGSAVGPVRQRRSHATVAALLHALLHSTSECCWLARALLCQLVKALPSPLQPACLPLSYLYVPTRSLGEACCAGAPICLIYFRFQDTRIHPSPPALIAYSPCPFRPV